MKKQIIKLVTAIMLAVSVLAGNISNIQAASGSVTVSASSSVTVGKTLTVTVKYSCSAGVGGAISYIGYNSNYFKLSSYPNNPPFNKNNGKLLAEGSTSSPNTASYTFKFVALKTGSSTITITTNDFIDGDSGSVSGYKTTVSKTITINAKTASTTTVTQSSDSSLSSLTVNGYDLAFATDTKDYKLYVAHDVSSLDIKATASSSKATVANIDSSLKEGWNEVKVVCTAEDKSSSTYTLNVYVDSLPTVWYQYKDTKLGVVANTDQVVIPEGFEAKELTVGDNKLMVYERSSITLLYVEDEQYNKQFYCYDAASDTLQQAYQPLAFNDKIYVALDVVYDSFAEQLDSETFSAQTVTIGDVELAGWKYNDVTMGEFNIVYLQDEFGKTGLYQYDVVDKTLQRYRQPVHQAFSDLEIALMAASIAGFMAIILATILLVKNQRRKRFS